MTFGLKFLLWMDETERNIERLELAKKYISVGKLSGAVGTYSNIDPFVEKYVCEKFRTGTGSPGYPGRAAGPSCFLSDDDCCLRGFP